MIKITQKDYIEFLKSLETNSVDFICIDPPYGKINNMQLRGQKERVN
jgi:DNA modification methylase